MWEPSLGGPLLMVAGGSGVVPFRAMLRDRAASGCEVRARLLYSSRSLEEVIYRDELTRFGAEDHTDVQLTLTRDWPEQWQGHRGRIDRRFLDETAWPAAEEPLVYVCGPSGFVEAVAEAFVGAGHHPDRIKTERFGPTGN